MTNLIIGGTGNVGSLVVRGMIERGHRVTVLTRSKERAQGLPDGAEGVVADLLEPSTLSRALKGAERVFLLNAATPTELQEGLTAVTGCRRAGVKRIVYLSIVDAERFPEIPFAAAKVATEKAIMASGIPFTVLRAHSFFQNDLWFKDAILKYGVYPQPIGSSGMSRVDVRDVAEGAVNALSLEGHEGRTYDIVGARPHRGEDCAAAYGAALKRKIAYAGDDLDAWEKQAAGIMPGWLVHSLRLAYESFQRGLVASAAQVASTEQLLGKGPRSFESFVAETVAEWQQTGARPAG